MVEEITPAKAKDPNTSPEDLLPCAMTYPEFVLQNPALPLLGLEDPAMFTRVVSQAWIIYLREVWAAECRSLSFKGRRIFNRWAVGMDPGGDADKLNSYLPETVVAKLRDSLRTHGSTITSTQLQVMAIEKAHEINTGKKWVWPEFTVPRPW